jgi:xylulokinase
VSSAPPRGGLVLGIDCSTTACKAIVWSASGEAVAEARASIPLLNPAPDAWEQDAEGYWAALCSSVKGALAAASDALGRAGQAEGGPACGIRAVCVTHQRETFVLTDERGAPLRPAIVWMDSRCRAEIALAVASIPAGTIQRISGKVPCTTPSMYKVMRALREDRALAAARPRVLDVHAFLVHRLTGAFRTSLASADPTGLVDMEARAWSAPLLSLAGLSPSQLPALLEPGARIGEVSAVAALACGLPEGLPVIAGAGDGQAAALGAGIASPGSASPGSASPDAPGTPGAAGRGEARAYLNLGTAIVSGVLSGSYLVDRAFRTLYGAAPGTFLLETDLKGGAFTVSWLVERLLGYSPEEAAAATSSLDALASRVAPGAGGLVLLPYWNGVMNPYWDDDASGLLLGLRGEHGPAHVFRAVLEGVALEQRVHLEGVERATGRRIDEVVAMGGGARSDLFCQIVADVLGKRVVRCRSAEATCLGAGILAAAAAGLHPSVEAAARAMTATGASFSPGPAQGFYDALFRDVYKGLYPALSGAMGRLAALTRRAPAG